MLKNHITIAFRNLNRQFLYSFINIFGLAVGMACSLVIFLYVYGEWNHDTHFKNADRIYRVGVSFFRIGQFANGPELLKEYLPKEFEGIEAFTSFQRNNNEVLRIGDTSFKEQVYYIDSSFFNVFNYNFIEGNATTVMFKPSSIVLTERMARKYFNDAPALGKIIEVGKEKVPHIVTAVVKDDNDNSHMKTSVWVSRTSAMSDTRRWTSAHVYNYVMLKKHTSGLDLNLALDRVVENHVYPASSAKQSGISLEQYRQDENSVRFLVLPLKQIYLHSKASLELSAGGNEANLYIFSIVALSVLALAAVNFINLSTARATRRAREVGIRKALGTSRGKLIVQFLIESVTVSLFSIILALFFTELFTAVFYWITDQPLSVNLWSNPWSVPGVFIFSVFVGLLAGIYPAIYLTSFQPVKVLKGNIYSGRPQRLRNSLVIFQFVISITLIICAIVIIRQLRFMSTKDLGFAAENVVTVDNIFHMHHQDAITFREKMTQLPGVQQASLHGGEPGSNSMVAFDSYTSVHTQHAVTINTYFGDHLYLETMGFRLVKGRNFIEGLASDSASVILNESAAWALGIDQDPIGVEVSKGIKVIGVVHDFHWESLRTTIAPTAIKLIRDGDKNMMSFSQLAIKVSPLEIQSVLQAAEGHWKSHVTGERFEYHFVDDNFGKLLAKEAVLGKAIMFFTVLAILISCLGLFGLAAYTTAQRTKEISIRKVLGATITNIVVMLNKQFTWLVLVSTVIAVPVSYFVSQQWLSGFAYRTELNVWIFTTGSVAGLVISYATVAFHSIKASKTNPAEILKSE